MSQIKEDHVITFVRRFPSQKKGQHIAGSWIWKLEWAGGGGLNKESDPYRHGAWWKTIIFSQIWKSGVLSHVNCVS